MDFKDFLLATREKLPPYTKTTVGLDIYSYTEHLLNEFIELLEKVSDDEYVNIFTTKRAVVDKVLCQKDKLLLAVKSFCKGDIVECYEIIFKEYFYEGLDIFKLLAYKNIPARGPLFRLRTNERNIPFNQNEMFHIPFDKVHLVNNQRFSLSGYPCLYLANSSYCCWEELNRPDLERCNFSVYATTRNLNIFDLTTPLEIKSADDLLRFPLILSCSISITPENAAFKPEYILPQAVLQCVIRFNNMRISKVHLDGILYLSTKVGERIFFKDEDVMANFVFPTVNRNSNAKFCSGLADMFVVSEAVTYQELWFKYPHLVTQQDENWSAKDGFYELSIFRKIEKFAMGKTIPKSKIVV